MGSFQTWSEAEDLCAAGFTVSDEFHAREVLGNDFGVHDVVLAGGRLPHPVDTDAERQLQVAAIGDHVVERCRWRKVCELMMAWSMQGEVWLCAYIERSGW